MFSVARTMVTEEHVHVHAGWARRKIPQTAIESARAFRQEGFKQGKVSVGLDGVVRTVVSTSSSRNAIEIVANERGRRHILTVGTDDPQGFLASVARSRRAAGRGRARPCRARGDARRVLVATSG
jgi:hypothetical protein